MSNITCYDSNGNLLKSLYQWDNNQTITVRGLDMFPSPVFHFCNRRSNIALVVTPEISGSEITVKIPNILLQQAEPIIAYLYHDTNNTGCRTIQAVHIPVTPRPKPGDYEFAENIDYISLAIINARLSQHIMEMSDISIESCAPEVIDIRVSYDGTVYDTAGDAVRALGEDIQNIRSEFGKYIGAKLVDGLLYEDSMLYLTSNGEIVSDPVKIVGGSGTGSEDTVQIIFMDDTGITEIGRQTVMKGTSGLWNGDTPTKLPTPHYEYIFDGWSRTIGGDVDLAVLNAIEADTYVYACFHTKTRLYTVRFLNGNTELFTTNVNNEGDADYGGADTSTLVKPDVNNPEYYEFIGWDPSPVNITENRDCVAKYIYTGPIEQTWAEISEISREGTGANYFSVGSLKDIHISGTVGTEEIDTTFIVYILGFNHNSDVEGMGIHFSGFKDKMGSDGADTALIDEKYQSSGSDGSKNFNISHWGSANYGGWAGCDLRYDILGSTNIAPSDYGTIPVSGRTGYDATLSCTTTPVPNTLMSALPADLRAVMKPINKLTDNEGYGEDTESKVKCSVDYLPLLAEFEVFGVTKYANKYEQNYQQQYEYFASGNSRIKYGHKNLGTKTDWSLRSTRAGNSHSFCYVNGYMGAIQYQTPNYSRDIAPIFMV